MNRKTLISAVEQSCALSGYNFATLTAESIAAHPPHFPVALLAEPKFQSITGRHHGRITYALTLHLLVQGAYLPPEQRREALSTLQSHALEIFSNLSTHPQVALVQELTINPTAHTLLNKGELGITCQAEVEVIF
ncbi:MAG: hypothetical protein IJX65_00410 [Alistipes sp.]|nr:hypothetical protein [Alistipes sp.]